MIQNHFPFYTKKTDERTSMTPGVPFFFAVKDNQEGITAWLIVRGLTGSITGSIQGTSVEGIGNSD